MSQIKSKKPELRVLLQDEWLMPARDVITGRYERYMAKLEQIEHISGSIVDYANGYKYFGFQRDDQKKGYWFREWLPRAESVYLFGDFNEWQRYEKPLTRIDNGVWEAFFPDNEYSTKLLHESRYKMVVVGDNGRHERIPAYVRRAVQDEKTKDFTGQFWEPKEQFDWQGDDFDPGSVGAPIIYECHTGMAQEYEGVGSYEEFERVVLPKIKALGYNTLQMMAVAEHPYYGSFGYHVSNYFAPSSRFGTPEELKSLIRKAHEMGIAVVMDLVHAHYVKNFAEGLVELDGAPGLYSPEGDAGYQPYWDSLLFDFGRDEVVHFLLSNVKYWLDEFHFDGFRFDGVTSMVYKHHGYTEFDNREKYFDHTINNDALTYLTLANKLIHDFRPSAISITEDVSGMPTMCSPTEDGGIGFDYRLGMAIPDFWIELLEDYSDEQWDIWDIWEIMTNRLPYVKTIAYAESHDQAMVGDKTIAFRLMDKEMYGSMSKLSTNLIVDRGMALHKMIRLITISLGGDGYLNFMGNEFGHPEWIDFPRVGNGWSYLHARRQWSLLEDELLRYGQLNQFDKSMLELIKENKILERGYAYSQQMDEQNKTMVYNYDGVLFVFNWHPERSISDYVMPVPHAGRYKVALSSDAEEFGGFGRIDEEVVHFSEPVKNKKGEITHHIIKVYNVSRTAVVYKLIE